MSRHPVVKRVNRWSRRLHRWGAIVTLVPVFVIVTTGILLQLKKDWSWVQPPAATGSGQEPRIGFDRILEAAAGAPEAGIADWSDIDRLDVRPTDGIVKVRAENGWEVQIDLATAEILQVAYRRSDLIESIHDGSILGDVIKLGVFLPAGVLLLGLWTSGAYLWFLPVIARRNGRRRRWSSRGRAAR